MDDLTICKKIAEIDGKEYFSDNLTSINIMAHCPALTVDAIFMYNPLTDDALNHQLMIKFECSVINVATGMFIAQCEMSTVDTDDDTNLNKAILLAIIEAHKES